MFYQQVLKVFLNDEYYQLHEALLFKLIFTSYTKSKMASHGFTRECLNYEWDCIDTVRKRTYRTIFVSYNFFTIHVIKRLWFAKNGVYNSKEMKEFIDSYARNNMEYLEHFGKFCGIKWLKLDM